MKCLRCKGLMTLERFSDFFLVFHAWKCINCGAILDHTISVNQQRSSLKPESEPVLRCKFSSARRRCQPFAASGETFFVKRRIRVHA